MPSLCASGTAASQQEGLDKDTWYIFERVAITKDLYTGGGRTFLSTEAAQEFRGLIYQQYGEEAVVVVMERNAKLFLREGF